VPGIDIGILALLLLPAILGLLYGLLNVLLSIAAWLLAVFVATEFSGWVSLLLAAHLEPLLRDIVAFAGVFIASLMAFTVLGHFVIKLFNRAGLTAVNRALGFCFGAGLGAALITVIVFLAGFTAVSKNAWWHEAVLLEPFQRIAVWGRDFLPADIAASHRYEPAPAPALPPTPGAEQASLPPAGTG